MAETASLPQVSLSNKMATVKVLAESPGLSSIPSTYAFPKNESDKQSSVADTEYDDHLIPVIDFSLLTSSPEVRSIIINDLREACQEWGFFKVCICIIQQLLQFLTCYSLQQHHVHAIYLIQCLKI